jgi:muconate cycloisomerase
VSVKIERVEVFGVAVPLIGEYKNACNVIDGLECVGPLKTTDDIVTRKLDISGGGLALPGGPGLGVVPDEEKLRKYRFEPVAVAA